MCVCVCVHACVYCDLINVLVSLTTLILAMRNGYKFLPNVFACVCGCGCVCVCVYACMCVQC